MLGASTTSRIRRTARARPPLLRGLDRQRLPLTQRRGYARVVLCVCVCVFGDLSDAPQSRGRPGDGVVPDPHAVTLSTAELSRLSSILDNLKPTQDSIKEAKDWIMARGKLAHDVVAFLRSRMAGSEMGGGFEHRLFILYLVNDVLLHSSRAKLEGQVRCSLLLLSLYCALSHREQPDFYTPAFQSAVGDICHATYSIAPADPERQKVVDLLGIWSAKSFYPPEFLETVRLKLTGAVRGGGESATKKLKADPYGYGGQ